MISGAVLLSAGTEARPRLRLWSGRDTRVSTNSAGSALALRTSNRSWQELIHWIDEVGFLPLFKNEINGFSAEEHTSDLYWWSGDPEQDPWEWWQLIARSGQVSYGKFLGKKAVFISNACFPHFANWRRDGYDFDSRWDAELASPTGGPSLSTPRQRSYGAMNTSLPPIPWSPIRPKS